MNLLAFVLALAAVILAAVAVWLLRGRPVADTLVAIAVVALGLGVIVNSVFIHWAHPVHT